MANDHGSGGANTETRTNNNGKSNNKNNNYKETSNTPRSTSNTNNIGGPNSKDEPIAEYEFQNYNKGWFGHEDPSLIEVTYFGFLFVLA